MRSVIVGAVAAALLTSGACYAQGTTGTAAASGNNNQAVAKTAANSPMPAKGANSFTMGQAKTRLEKAGYSDVTDLQKDSNGVWHGKAQRSGMSAMVWLDYKGNVGQSAQ